MELEQYRKLSIKYKISENAFYNWRYNYNKYGIDGLRESRTCKRYSKELKDMAVKDYLSGEYSQREIAKKYEISDKSVLKSWINKYNGHREIKATTKGMSQSMTKGRDTSWEERIEIALYCIAQNKDYQKLLRFIAFPTSKYINGLRNMNLVEKMP